MEAHMVKHLVASSKGEIVSTPWGFRVADNAATRQRRDVILPPVLTADELDQVHDHVEWQTSTQRRSVLWGVAVIVAGTATLGTFRGVSGVGDAAFALVTTGLIAIATAKAIAAMAAPRLPRTGRQAVAGALLLTWREEANPTVGIATLMSRMVDAEKAGLLIDPTRAALARELLWCALLATRRADTAAVRSTSLSLHALLGEHPAAASDGPN
ncbi:hypothetical protein [Cellulosimicrobium funkei]|uniref:hypothetical protein n=1 Tax=Cellulosimicrobium funkei TaxID=264251 RepID=UPI0036AC92E7